MLESHLSEMLITNAILGRMQPKETHFPYFEKH